MKKAIITIALTAVLFGCKKSETELQIEHYELQKVKLEYLETLMKTKQKLSYDRKIELIDSLISQENERLSHDKN